ncbi:MAG: glycosyltransferase family 1 protein [Deltaproteobacteria bacterium]|nr:glycosyltransferase family 1 protein [Deltaproteobacteria bacterium]
MNNRVRYVFYYPSSGIGGAQLLFGRIAEALINDGRRVLIVEENNSYISKYLGERKLEFDVVKVPESNHFSTTADDILVLPLSYVFLFRQFVDAAPETRLVFWDLHPHNLIETTAFSKIYKEFPGGRLSSAARLIERRHLHKINVFAAEASSKQALYFMCLRNFSENKEFFKLGFDPIYLPIPIHVMETNNLSAKDFTTSERPLKHGVIHVGWISRMDVDKLRILALLIEDAIQFNKIHDDFKVLIHAIGDEKACNRALNKKNQLGDVLRLPGVLLGADLDAYLAENIDVGFSMGTAALEFASRQVPTVLVPNTDWHKLFEKDRRRYFWLFDSHGYDVAVENFHLESKARDFEAIISHFLRVEDDLGMKSYNYIMQNHSFNKVFKRFKELTNESALVMADLDNIGLYDSDNLQSFLLALKRFYKEMT